MENAYAWYKQLIKPTWAPPSSLFGPVWSVLYVIIAMSFGTVFYRAATKQLPWPVAVPFALNLIFNAAFTPLQFGLRNNLLASIDILLILGTLIWAIVSIYPHSKALAYAQIPYLIWVTFASILQLTITVMNR